MKLLIPGLRKFAAHVYPHKQTLFNKLAKGQTPHTMMISCSDSRIDPNLITQTEPGELFVLRNAGNIIPPYLGAITGGEQATIEFAIEGLKVSNMVVCGHSFCGAMQALNEPKLLKDFPSLEAWLKHAETTRRRMKEIKGKDNLIQTTQENILAQIENLKTHPAVYNGIRSETLNVFGWFYDIKKGEILVYSAHHSKFVPTQELLDHIEGDIRSLSFGI